jgi:hypothetical protein
MAKTVDLSLRTLECVAQALLAVKETFVKDKDEKDAVIKQAFEIIKKELTFIESEQK